MMFTRLARQLGRDVGARLFHHDHQQHIVSNLVPIVIESTPKGERAWDIFSRLLRERIVYVNGPIHQNSADVIVAQLLFLESEDPDKPVRCGGGYSFCAATSYSTLVHNRLACTSTRPGVWSARAWLFTTPCNTSAAQYTPWRWAMRHPWHPCFLQLGKNTIAAPCPTRA